MDKIVVIAPHPDDEVLGCGGTLAKYVSEGNKVFVIIVTNAFVGAPELFTQDAIKRVRQEALEAHKVLGVSETYFLDFPAPMLDAYPNYKISNGIEKILKKIEPDIVYLPHPGDAHLDHRAVFQSSMVTLRPVSRYLKAIYTYETQSETEWAAPYSSEIFFPTSFNILSKSNLNAKLKAMDCFNGQLKPSPNPRSLEKITALASYRGGIINCEYAESFYVIREINK